MRTLTMLISLGLLASTALAGEALCPQEKPAKWVPCMAGKLSSGRTPMKARKAAMMGLLSYVAGMPEAYSVTKKSMRRFWKRRKALSRRACRAMFSVDDNELKGLLSQEMRLYQQDYLKLLNAHGVVECLLSRLEASHSWDRHLALEVLGAALVEVADEQNQADFPEANPLFVGQVKRIREAVKLAARSPNRILKTVAKGILERERRMNDSVGQ